MRDRILFSIGILCIGILCFVVAGCGSSPSARYYTLSSLQSTQPVQRPAAGDAGAFVRLGPVDIPDYLDRPQIVTRTNGNELKLSEFDRWGGSLRNDISRVLIENLSAIFSVGQITVAPWKQYTPGAYRVPVTISRLDVTPGGSLFLKTQWSIIDKDGKTMTTIGESNITLPVNGTGYNTIVAAINNALADLSKEIAVSVKTAVAREK